MMRLLDGGLGFGGVVAVRTLDKLAIGVLVKASKQDKFIKEAYKARDFKSNGCVHVFEAFHLISNR